MSRGTRGRRGFRAELIAFDEAFTLAPPSPAWRAMVDHVRSTLPPELRQLPDWAATTVGQGAPNPLVRPVGRVWQGLQAPPDGTEPCLAERLRARQHPVVLGNGRRNGRSYRRRQLRESPDGVLAIYDPARGGDRHRPWLVIDVPAGHLSHHRDQPLTDRDVQDWDVLIRATGWTRTEQP
ncbi:hypothetical protein SAMN04489727_1694 [Amycolatopsis tolypomycina]|uniref:Uncharacterized protein n=1 Tax=Amycolatopsis tolypomycina TaxID=208445 RepID=A0A1H4JA74_9PSEU|nr:hypothetical protein [Amycolatopsis tolypomycina]SEB43229.1 hypothetical protein SAMN04489727_1694 [Amycolatopsis tolypomycina]